MSEWSINTLNKFTDEIHQTYRHFCLNQFQVNVQGLYKEGSRYFIYCPDIKPDEKDNDGQDLSSWIHRKSSMFAKIEITQSLPPDAKQVAYRGLSDLFQQKGRTRFMPDFINDLLFELPKNFPEFEIEKSRKGYLILYTKEVLSEIQFNEFKNVIDQLEIPIRIVFQTKDSVKPTIAKVLNENFLFNSRVNLVTGRAKQLQEYDEDFWRSNRDKFLKPNFKKDDFLPKSFVDGKLSAFISDGHSPVNIKNYLTIYDKLTLKLPIQSVTEKYFESIGIDEKTIQILAERNIVNFVIDKPLQRYHPRVIDLISEVGTDKIITPRNLAFASYKDQCTRFPLFFGDMDLSLQQNLLKHLSDYSKKTDRHVDLAKPMAKILDSSIDSIQNYGPLTMLSTGAHIFLDSILSSRGIDRSIELMDSESAVSQASTLNSHVIPTVNAYDNSSYCQLIANYYSGVPKDFVFTDAYNANMIIDNVLVIDDDISALDLVDGLNHRDVKKFRETIKRLSSRQYEPEELTSTIRTFNQYIKSAKTNRGVDKTLDLQGFLTDLAGMPVGIPMFGYLSTVIMNILEQTVFDNGYFNHIRDAIEANSKFTLPYAVMVARMRDSIIDSKNDRKLKSKEML